MVKQETDMKKELIQIKKQINSVEHSKEPDLSKLRKARDELSEEIMFIENNKRLGKCYKYRNGSGGKHWWLFTKIIKINKEEWPHFRCERFEETPNGIFFCIENSMDHIFKKEITSKEYKNEKNKMLKKMKLK
jgi:hypothetical protein